MPDFDPATIATLIRPAAVDLGKCVRLCHDTITVAGKRVALVAATGPGLQRLRDRIAQQPGLVDVFKLDRNRGAGTSPTTIDRTRGAGET